MAEDMLDHDLRGEWDEVLALADSVIAAAAESPHYHEGPARTVRAGILLGRGNVDRALVDAERGLALARAAKDAQVVGPALLFHARVLVGAARQQEADRLLVVILHDHDLADPWLHQLPLLLVGLGRGREYLAALGDEQPATPWLEAGRAAASGDLRRAAARLVSAPRSPSAALANRLSPGGAWATSRSRQVGATRRPRPCRR